MCVFKVAFNLSLLFVQFGFGVFLFLQAVLSLKEDVELKVNYLLNAPSEK